MGVSEGEGFVAVSTVYISFSAEVNQATTESLLGTCSKILRQRKKVETVYLLLSTPGGTVMDGLNLYNLLRAMPFKLITHNVGTINSVGNVIFLAGEERYSNPHATFMFHGVGVDVTHKIRFEEKNLRERLDSLMAEQTRMANILAERTKLTMGDIQALFLQAVTKDPDYARTHGIIHDIREFQLPDGAPFLHLVFQR